MKAIEMEKPGTRTIKADEVVSVDGMDEMNLNEKVVSKGTFSGFAFLLPAGYEWIVGTYEGHPLLVPTRRKEGKA